MWSSVPARITTHAAFLATGTHLVHWSIWRDPSEAAGQTWQIQELFFHRSRVTQESCGIEMTYYTKKHVVDYCSTCGVVQRMLHCEYLQEKHVGAEKGDMHNHHHLC